jgi:hypothetical protein
VSCVLAVACKVNINDGNRYDTIFYSNVHGEVTEQIMFKIKFGNVRTHEKKSLNLCLMVLFIIP